MKREMVSDHLPSYKRREETISIEKRIISLVSEVEQILKRSKKEIKILEVGCGLGTLVELLTNKGYDVIGVDGDKNCVEITQKYGKAILLDAHEIGNRFSANEFDIIIFKDSLEHFNNPLFVLNQAKNLAKWIIISVPNPARPEVYCFTNLFRINYSNPGHLCCWDRSHFYYFLTHKADLEIVRWAQDEVKLFVGPLIRITKALKKLKIDFISPIEEHVLTKIFPYYATSCIVLAKVKSK